jgi:hypothetical protein
MADTQPERLYDQLKGPGEPQFPAGSSLAAKTVFIARPNNEERFNSISLLWQ